MPLCRNSYCRPFGLAICEKCVKFGSTKVPYSHFSRFQKGVAFHQWNLLMDPQLDPKTGEVNGPLLEVLELQQIENSYSTSDEKKGALEGIVATVHTNESKDCSLTYEEKAAAFHEIFENAEREADDHVASALEQDQQKYRERREERIAKRMTRIRSIYAILEAVLNDCPLKDLALDCTWLEVSGMILRPELMNTSMCPLIFDMYCTAFTVFRAMNVASSSHATLLSKV